eukprot:10070835-Karenia_brevis.AAC.1
MHERCHAIVMESQRFSVPTANLRLHTTEEQRTVKMLCEFKQFFAHSWAHFSYMISPLPHSLGNLCR